MRPLDLEPLDPILKTQTRSSWEPSDLDMIEKAYLRAARAHAGQKRKSGDPYITHPLTTARRLADMGLDAHTIAAALLHDTCEDTSYTIADMQKEFGEEIARMVRGVTKLDRFRYQGNERGAESLRKMFLAVGEDIRIVILKLVDRLHNMETLAYLAPEKQKRIARETIEIYAPLAYRLGIGELKGRLEDLAFPYVAPEEYTWLMENLKSHYEERLSYIERLKPIVAQELAREKIPFLDIHARAKHYYSLYKKLPKYNMDVGKVHDLIALRVIVSTVEECYATLGALHGLWRPVPGFVKDYIALPKPNGYQSLHTTVFGSEGKKVEFQIRTKKMHEEAEFGIAAHWAYAAQKTTKAYGEKRISFAKHRELAWIKQLREWQKDFEKPNEFLEALKIDFFQDRIFALTPKGEAFDLPEGATPVDFAYHIHSDIGNAAVGARVNDKMVPLHYALKNGDVVEILTQKNKKPSAGWLGFVKSANARKKIASFLKKRAGNVRASRKTRGERRGPRNRARPRGTPARYLKHICAAQHQH